MSARINGFSSELARLTSNEVIADQFEFVLCRLFDLLGVIGVG